MKFKVGDRVESKEFGKGTIREIDTQDSILVQFDRKDIRLHSGIRYEENTCCWCAGKELELITEKQFTKSDLQDGDIVTYRNGKKRMKVGKIIQKENCYNNLEDYNEDLTYKSNEESDIIKIERPVKYETVFERKEEILDKAEKRYLSGVIRPFRDKVRTIEKRYRSASHQIVINMRTNETICLPVFDLHTMYRNMKTDVEYTPEELRTIKESDVLMNIKDYLSTSEFKTRPQLVKKQV